MAAAAVAVFRCTGWAPPVFWSEGDVVCVLVSDMPAEDTISLAIAKAMKA